MECIWTDGMPNGDVVCRTSIQAVNAQSHRSSLNTQYTAQLAKQQNAVQSTTTADPAKLLVVNWYNHGEIPQLISISFSLPT